MLIKIIAFMCGFRKWFFDNYQIVGSGTCRCWWNESTGDYIDIMSRRAKEEYGKRLNEWDGKLRKDLTGYRAL